MPVTDPISDLLTRIRNAARARKTLVRVPYSNMKSSICNVLKEKGYVLSINVNGDGVTKELVVEIPENRQDLHLRAISKPGQRIYLGSREIPRVLNGLGLAILSTPKGIMSGDDARKKKLGGEYLCEIF